MGKEGERKRQFIDTKAFTVINQIYLQFIQMFVLQQKNTNPAPPPPISQEAKAENKFIQDITALHKTEYVSGTAGTKTESHIFKQ